MRRNVLFFFGFVILLLISSCGEESFPTAPENKNIQDNIQTEIAFEDIESLEIIDFGARSVQHGPKTIENIFQIGQGRTGEWVVLVFHYWKDYMIYLDLQKE